MFTASIDSVTVPIWFTCFFPNPQHCATSLER
jgi:hypothetical protein